MPATTSRSHRYGITTEWTGNDGRGTADYRAYRRDHVISAASKQTVIEGSSDAMFRGDKTRWNPEELFLAAISSCHMLWLLHLCADAGIEVQAYRDSAQGTMREEGNGAGHFVEVVLHPHLTVKDPSRVEEAKALNARAHQMCFLANSVNFPVRHEPIVHAPS